MHPLKELHGKAKLQYFFDYYKLPFILTCIIIYIIISIFIGHITKKTVLLYIAYPNVNLGDELHQQLENEYVLSRNFDPQKNNIYTYMNLYISKAPSDENLDYAYASLTNILAAIDSEKLDLVFMNQESREVFIAKGYLADLTTVLDSDLTQNEESKYSIDVSNLSLFQNAELSDHLYVGIIENSPRKTEALRYIQYLVSL